MGSPASSSNDGHVGGSLDGGDALGAGPRTTVSCAPASDAAADRLGPIPVVGEVVAGKYRIERVLGSGGMGRVVEARHLVLGGRVALKFLLAANAPESRARFHREAKVASRLRGDRIAKVLDLGTTDAGTPFLVMELVEGPTLAQLLVERERLGAEEAVDVAIQLAQAASEAHELGIVHRDLKPPNILVCSRTGGSLGIKVLDFGIAKILDPGGGAGVTSGAADLTAGATLLGSPAYMSPEQIRDPSGVDARSDVWAIGVVLYEMLAGRPPFVAALPSGLLAAVVADAPPPLAEAAPSVPPTLARVIERCLRKDPADRPASARALSAALAPFASVFGRSIVAAMAAQPEVAGSGLPTAVDPAPATTQATWDRPEIPTTRARGLRWVGAAVAALVAAWIAVRQGDARAIPHANATVASFARTTSAAHASSGPAAASAEAAADDAAREAPSPPAASNPGSKPAAKASPERPRRAAAASPAPATSTAAPTPASPTETAPTKTVDPPKAPPRSATDIETATAVRH